MYYVYKDNMYVCFFLNKKDRCLIMFFKFILIYSLVIFVEIKLKRVKLDLKRNVNYKVIILLLRIYFLCV